MTIHYTACPVCDGITLEHIMDVKDHTVSGDMFPLVLCRKCSLVFTQDVPTEDEIGPFYAAEAYISHTDTDKGLVNNLYHRIRKITLRQKRKMIISRTGKQTGKLLDIGSGTGAFLAEMRKTGWEITGIEPDSTARSNASRIHGVKALEPSALGALPAAEYDAITMWHVLEHVHNLHGYMDRICEMLKPGGTAFIAVPNYTSTDAEIYGAAWAAWDVPRHLYHFSPKSMHVLAERHGMEITAELPMWFDSFYVSMLSEKYQSGKDRLLHAGFAGLRSNLSALKAPGKASSVIYVLRKRSR